MRDIYVNSAAMRANLHHDVLSGAWTWQSHQAILMKPSSKVWTRPVQFRAQTGYSTAKQMLREDGYIQGVLTDSAVPVANALVVLLWRDPVAQIAWTRTNASGVYRFDYLDSTRAMYCAVHFDPAGGTQWNAQRLDWLTPTAY
jgi:hypothetical protein